MDNFALHQVLSLEELRKPEKYFIRISDNMDKICYTLFPGNQKKKAEMLILSAFPPTKKHAHNAKKRTQAQKNVRKRKKTCARGFEANLKCPKIQ